jgi:hypothetical protein
MPPPKIRKPGSPPAPLPSRPGLTGRTPQSTQVHMPRDRQTVNVTHNPAVTLPSAPGPTPARVTLPGPTGRAELTQYGPAPNGGYTDINMAPGQHHVDMQGNRHPLVQAVISRLAPVATAVTQAVMPQPAPQMPAMNTSPSEAIARDPRATSHIAVGDAPPDQAPPTSAPVPAYAQGGPIVAGPNRDASWNRQAPPQSPLEQWQHAVVTAVQNGTISIEDAQRLMSTQRVPD